MEPEEIIERTLQKRKKIIGIFFIIGILLLLSALTLYLSADKKIVEIDCYDEDHNKIIGLKCEQGIAIFNADPVLDKMIRVFSILSISFGLLFVIIFLLEKLIDMLMMR